MSMIKLKERIEEGDCVVMYAGKDNYSMIQIIADGQFNHKFGTFSHKELIGVPYGSKVYSQKRKGWLHVLHPTPELWTLSLRHRTQILYNVDISLVLMHLEIKPGSIVIESGTGSGSLSTSIARAVAPTGRLYTFEFHEQRAAAAREDFRRNGIDGVVTVTWRDVCEQGFAVEGMPKVDAVFLDLPSPWLAVKKADEVMREDGMLCSFSPCIEQVQRTCEELRARNFEDILTLECLLRPCDVREASFESISFPATASASISPAASSTSITDTPSSSSSSSSSASATPSSSSSASDAATSASSSATPSTSSSDAAARSPSTPRNKKRKAGQAFAPSSSGRGAPTMLVTRPVPEIKGHTGFLTFARKSVPFAEGST